MAKNTKDDVVDVNAIIENINSDIDKKMQSTDYFSKHFISALTKSADMQKALKDEFDKCYQNKWTTYKSDVVKNLAKAGLWFASIILTVVITVIVTNKISKQQPTQKTEVPQVK